MLFKGNLMLGKTTEGLALCMRTMRGQTVGRDPLLPGVLCLGWRDEGSGYAPKLYHKRCRMALRLLLRRCFPDALWCALRF